jgi:hypothetical protein
VADRTFVLVIEEDGSTLSVGQHIAAETTRPGGDPVIRIIPMGTVVDMMNRHLKREDEYKDEIDRLKSGRRRKVSST